MKFLFPILCLLLLSCQPATLNSNLHIDVPAIFFDQTKELVVDDYFDTTRYVFLETKKECLISSINKVRLWKDRIFVFDNSGANAIYAFDINTGTFLFQVGKKGKAPGEYVFIVDFTLNEDEIVILDQAHNNPKRYSCLNGEFLGFDDLVLIPTNGVQVFEIHDETYYFHSGNAGYSYNYSLTTVNRITGDESKALPYDGKNKCTISPDNSIIAKDDSIILVAQLFNDTVYAISGQTISPSLVVASQHGRVDGEELLNFEQKDGNPSFYSYLAGHWGSPHKLLCNEKNIYLEWGYNERRKVQIFFNKETGKSIFTTSVRSEKGNFLGEILFVDNEFYYSILGIDNPELRAVFNDVFDANLTTSSNPVLAIHKIK